MLNCASSVSPGRGPVHLLVASAEIRFTLGLGEGGLGPDRFTPAAHDCWTHPTFQE